MHTLLLLSLPVLAHRPYFSEGHTSPETAFAVEDPDISIVLYDPVACEGPEVWMRFEAEAGYTARFQLGVPEIDRLAGYRPSLAVLAPGLPALDLPFAVPEGVGGVVYDTADQDPDAFYEPFTRTRSWMLVEEELVLPEGGPAWLVAWDPEGWSGKLWVALGTVEDFSGVTSEDFLSWSEGVQDFHETGVFEEPPEIEEQDCAPEEAAPAVEGAEEEAARAGCASAPGGASAAGLGLALLALLRRRASATRGVEARDR